MEIKIRKGDTVEVISGSTTDKGKRGEVVRVIPSERRVVVQGVSIVTKHQRQVQSQGRTVSPGIVRFEGPISVSNVMLVCKHCNKPTRVTIHREGDSVQRICKECGAVIDD
jgi:large subunit ribosomal protein L24